MELLVQLKASATQTKGDSEVVRIEVSTYNYLKDKLQVVMLVKYVESEDQAYWLLLRDIPPPPADQNTVSVRIPRSNRISDISWDDIKDHLRRVTDQKLARMRRHELNGG